MQYNMRIWHYEKKDCNVSQFEACVQTLVPVGVTKTTPQIALRLKKFAMKYIQPFKNKDFRCALMILENLAKPEWISIPCFRKVLTDIICVKQFNESNNQGGERNEELIYAALTSNTFQCQTGEIIALARQCDGYMDCKNGEDEKGCICHLKGYKVTNSYYCIFSCKRPECFCSKLLFQSHSGGCHQYNKLVSANNKTSVKSIYSSSKSFTCPNETMQLDVKLLNDLVPDCSSNADENLLYSLLTNVYIHNVSQISKTTDTQNRHCFDGHPQTYHTSETCIYRTDQYGNLQPCRNGRHLENCKHFNCRKILKFKCPRYYCIPMGYVCDGKVDCPKSFDELDCWNHSCSGLFHCTRTSQCIYIDDVCNGVYDCLNIDDEISCDLLHTKCVDHCSCLGYAISCYYINENVNLQQVVENRIFVSVKGNKIAWNLRWLENLRSVQFLHLTDFQLTDICSIFAQFLYNSPNVLSVAVNNNTITSLKIKCLNYYSGMLSLNFSHNLISVVEQFSFIGQTSLKALDLSINQINILSSKSFFGLVRLVFLKINQNPLKFIVSNLFKKLNHLKLINTDNFRLCCVKPSTEVTCNSLVRWPASCRNLISNLSLNISMWVIMLLVSILNVSSVLHFIVLVRSSSKQRTNFHVIAVCLNFSDLACGVYLALIVLSNIYYKGSYAVNELHWRSHVVCLIASYLFTFFQLSSISIVVFMTMIRLLVTIDPFRSRFRTFSFTVKSLLGMCICILAITVILTSFVSHFSESNLLPNGLCNIFFDPLGNSLYTIPAIILGILQLTTCFTIVSIYVFLYYTTRASFTKQKCNAKAVTHRKMIIQIFLITSSNIICWVPSSSIYISSVLMNRFPTSLLLYTTFYVTPVNSIVHPIFTLSANARSTSRSTNMSSTVTVKIPIPQTFSVQEME